jgi:hypothetical protein
MGVRPRPPSCSPYTRLAACVGNRDHATIVAIVRTAFADADTLAALRLESVHLAASMAKALKAVLEGGGN